MKKFHENDIPKDVVEEDDDEEPVIYTLDLTQDTQHYNLDTNLHTYLINESGSLLVPTTNEYFSDQLTDLK